MLSTTIDHHGDHHEQLDEAHATLAPHEAAHDSGQGSEEGQAGGVLIHG